MTIPATKTREVTCYGQTNNGLQCQEVYDTTSRDARRRARQLRQTGYRVIVCTASPQVTTVGIVRLTMLHILPGGHADTCDLPTTGWRLERI